MAAGGDAGRFVGKGQNAFQLVHGQGVQLLLAELGQSRPKEGVPCAVGVAHLAGNASHMASLVPKAVEYAVCPQGDKNQLDSLLCQLRRAAFTALLWSPCPQPLSVPLCHLRQRGVVCKRAGIRHRGRTWFSDCSRSGHHLPRR